MRAVVVSGAGVHAALLRHTLDWARRIDPEAVVVDSDAAARAAVEAAGGPVVVVWADTPRLGEVHAAGVRSDLEAGGQLVVAPTLDGGVYLMAMSEPRAELIGQPFARVLELAAAARLETGMLRHERRTVRPEDVRALLADPLLAEEIRLALSSD